MNKTNLEHVGYTFQMNEPKQNILDQGLRDLYGFTSDELADYRRGDM